MAEATFTNCVTSWIIADSRAGLFLCWAAGRAGRLTESYGMIWILKMAWRREKYGERARRKSMKTWLTSSSPFPYLRLLQKYFPLSLSRLIQSLANAIINKDVAGSWMNRQMEHFIVESSSSPEHGWTCPSCQPVWEHPSIHSARTLIVRAAARRQ